MMNTASDLKGNIKLAGDIENGVNAIGNALGNAMPPMPPMPGMP